MHEREKEEGQGEGEVGGEKGRKGKVLTDSTTHATHKVSPQVLIKPEVLGTVDSAYPTTKGGMQSGSSVGIFWHQFVKIFASDLSRKLIKSALLVG